MAVDKLVDSTQLDADLTSVANAIRTKGGTSADLAFPSGFVSAVQAIPTGTTPTGTKSISITENGTTTEDVAAYANAEITVNVQGGGGVPVESGVFTVATKTRTYDINHSLGVVPNFIFIYPLDVHSETETYLIGSQLICGDFGQSNWTIGTNTTVRNANHAYGVGNGYSVSVHSSIGSGDDLPQTPDAYAGLFTNEFVRVGGTNQTNASGWLLGTYGYFVGVMPIETNTEGE